MTAMAVAALGGRTVRLTFEDGQTGIVDLTPLLWGPGFEELDDDAAFRRVRVEPEARALVWPNGADIALATLRELAEHDRLTGLPSRLGCSAKLEWAMSQCMVAVFFLDMDRLQHLNHEYGHDVGNQALVAISKRLVAVAGPQFVARLGGDEYVVLLEGPSPTEVVELAERILAAFRAPVLETPSSITLTATIGVALSGPGASPDDVLRAADLAMHEGKNRGRDCYVVWPFEPAT